MLGIFKWFFGIVVGIILIYVIFVLAKSVFVTGVNTISDVSNSSTTKDVLATTTTAIKNFSILDLFKNFHPFKFAPIYVGYQAQNDLYWQNLNDAPNDHPTDWAPVNSNSQGNGNSQRGDNRYIQVFLSQNSTIHTNQIISGFAYKDVFLNRAFQVLLLDSSGNVIGSNKAFVNGAMQENGYVPFRAVLDYSFAPTNDGYIVFKNENSDDTGINAETIIPIRYSRSYYHTTMPQMLFPSPNAND